MVSVPICARVKGVSQWSYPSPPLAGESSACLPGLSHLVRLQCDSVDNMSSDTSKYAQGGEQKSYVEKLAADRERYKKLTQAMMEKIVPVKYKRFAEPVSTPLSFVLLFFAVVGPLMVNLSVQLYKLYKRLPHNIINGIV
eukprot:8354978-Pyramimonas_sp.AAC.1